MASPPENRVRKRDLKLGAILDENYEKKLKQLKQQGKQLKPEENVFLKTVTDLRSLEAKGMPEADMIKEGQSLIRSLKNDGKFDSLSSDLKAYLSRYYEDEDARNKKQEKGKGSSQGPRSPKNGQEASQGVNIGPAPIQSSSSPTFKHTTEIAVGMKNSQSAEEMQKQINTLEKELAEKREEVKKNERKLMDRMTEIKELVADGLKKDSKIKDLEQEASHLAKSLEEKKLQWTNVTKDLEFKQKITMQLEARVNECATQELEFKETLEGMKTAYKKLEKEKSQIEKSKQREIEHMQEVMKDEKRKYDDQYKKLMVERDDLRDRFSKLAGAKLQEKNADIADLSDPNRAMKLSERFGQIYDDEWTNAFESLTDKKINLPLKDAIALLLRFLQECWSFCNKLMTTQMESVHSVFLHPSQNLASFKPKQIVGGLKDHPRISSKDDKTLFAVRRQIGVSPTVIEEVKQALLSESKTWNKEKTGYEKKLVEACAPYLLKCAEICWLMALHDPPLYMKMDVKPGEKLDQNIYTVYSSSGNSIDFLVWPPLLNGKDGGLLAKGVAEPQRTVSKKK